MSWNPVLKPFTVSDCICPRGRETLCDSPATGPNRDFNPDIRAPLPPTAGSR